MDEYNLVPASEIPANASHYEWMRGMPDVADMQFMWASWSAVSFVAAASSAAIFVGVLSSPKARASSFNLYLVMLTVPDFVFSINCAVTCALNFSSRFYISVQMCHWQAWYLTFGIAGSFWLNAAVAAEVHNLLKHTKRLMAYHPPSHRTVLARCLAICAFCAVVSSWHSWRVLPLKTSPVHGLACIANDHDRHSTFFFWLAYIPMVAGLPTAYASYIAIDCWRRSLLSFTKATPGIQGSPGVSVAPPDGASCIGMVAMDALQQQIHARRSRQARQLSIYFGRIFLSVLAMWVPSTFFFLMFPMRSSWGVWAGGTWGHLQGLVSAIMCLTKPDILKAVLDLFRCRCCRADEELRGTKTSAEKSQFVYDAGAVASIRHSETKQRWESEVADR